MEMFVVKRNGNIAKYDRNRIYNAIKKAIIESKDEIPTKNIVEMVDQIETQIKTKFIETKPTVENIQDIVEGVLIKNEYTNIAKLYILYREKHKELRQKHIIEEIEERKLRVKDEHGILKTFDTTEIKAQLEKLSRGLNVNSDIIISEIVKTMYDGITASEINKSILNAVKSMIDIHYDYSYLSARILLYNLYKNILKEDNYKTGFPKYVAIGIKDEILNPELGNFDLEKLSEAIHKERDKKFLFLGMQTINDRYLLRDRTEKKVFELPQWMFMRIAMGLSLKEENRNERAIEFYNLLSNHYVLSSSPTLFNSGTVLSQMSSCFLNTVEDSLTGIFKNYGDCGQLSKLSGGIGTDWTAVRAKGATIKGTNGESQGIIPFIKIYNDVALAVNQGGKRKGAMAAYLEIWHADIHEFLDLRKNTGDERRRAHDIHTALSIPDLFMKRVKEGKDWSLFSPDAAKELISSYGKEFEKNYLVLEQKGVATKTMPAAELWQKIITRLYETGHPWITFKDAMNLRNPQAHKGMIHSSNLCTEITLNTNKDETAVCNLASINLSKMIDTDKGELDEELIRATINTAIRMLDNVIDVNFYPIPEAKNSNFKHRPIGLGMMGYQDALYKLKIDFDSDENLDFADKSMEMISYYTILASSRLAKEKGAYQSYDGSLWSKDILPIDTIKFLEDERGDEILVDRKTRMDWSIVRNHIKEYGMRNSNTMALAPTATIANIAGTTPSVEPIFKNIYMKENMSGNFLVLNKFLVDALDKKGLWNQDNLTKIKINNGSVIGIDEIPVEIQRRFKECFEIKPEWIIKAAALRSKWIDQSASTNIFMNTTSGKAVSDVYMKAWEHGLKTTYYLRTLAASQITKTVEITPQKKEVKLCSIENPDCDACQ